MQKVIVARRSVLALLAALGATATMARAEIRRRGPVANVIEDSIEAGNEVSKSVSEYAQGNPQFKAYLIAAARRFENILSFLVRIIEGQVDGIGEIDHETRFIDELNGRLDRSSSVVDVKTYASSLAELINDCASILKTLVESPSELSDEDFVRLFTNIAAISVLNASALNFPPSES